MMPISEFHFAFCGIATVAATLGYACARRAVRSLSVSPNEPPKADVEAGPQEERSLKRKLDDSDEHDVDAEEQSRPMKRNRTPPTDKREPDEDIKFILEWEVVVAPPPYEEVVGFRQMEQPVQDHSTPQLDPPGSEQDATPVREPTPQADPDASNQKEKGAEAGLCSTPSPPPPSEPEIPTPPRPDPVTPPKASVPTITKPINAFSAFSGSSSPFGSYTNASGTSPFALPGQNTKATPAWRRNKENESGVFGQACSTDALVLSPNDVLTSATTRSPAPSKGKDPLGVSSETQPPVKASTCLTGEEDETVEAELKGVKLFVKRGRKEFTDGIYGHVKILTRKSMSETEDPQDTEAKTDSRTRLLFRRDPLGQVSMNAGLRPTVRCHFDTAENILRVILMETVTTDEQNLKEDVVVYALKPGRAQKADFQSFAKVLCDHEGLKSRLAAGLTAFAAT